MPEKLSALMDGELGGASLDAVLELLNHPEELARLDMYHHIRHVLRKGESGVTMSPDFSASMIATLRNL